MLCSDGMIGKESQQKCPRSDAFIRVTMQQRARLWYDDLYFGNRSRWCKGMCVCTYMQTFAAFQQLDWTWSYELTRAYDCLRCLSRAVYVVRINGYGRGRRAYGLADWFSATCCVGVVTGSVAHGDGVDILRRGVPILVLAVDVQVFGALGGFHIKRHRSLASCKN